MTAPAFAPPALTPATAELYDFRRPHHLSRDRQRTLEAMYERLVRSLEQWLVGRLRGQVELGLTRVDVCSFGEFAQQLPLPCAAYAFEILNTGGQQGVVDVGHDFAYLLVDRFFGGAGAPSSMERALSPIERLTVRILVERLLTLLAETWKEHVPLDLALKSFESMPEMVRIATREEPVLVARIAVAAGPRMSSITLCLPAIVLDRFLASREQQRVVLAAGTDLERQAKRELAEKALRATLVEVAARLPAFEVPLRQLMQLGVGSVLSTGVPTTAPLHVSLADKERYVGAPGRVGSKLAVRITDLSPKP
ncbi:MAG: FliM/FliN family flagellar motor switch protein [Gemmatimonadetes bacterium]|nr:FliM/FliN family flagellar motor switch protein [Gemmatimonadota bacterium]